ncbi:MAG: hypothetical protein A2X43_12060 [Candidatus Margulisbacteria bacterium GWD2_39_127]|nr:MAG: hypothetical protein A2X43_12060 [Candidatus Margulisbacteria bacterium GWD2_39_127]
MARTMGTIKIGQKAPEFCLRDQNSLERCLSDYLGKWVVVYFYPEDDTSGCTKEARAFTAARDEFGQLNTEILGISPDPVESHLRFVNKYGIEITLLSDPDHEFIQKYGAWKVKQRSGKEADWGLERSTVLIDPDGIVQYIWPHVRVDGHVQEVKDALTRLQVQYASGGIPPVSERQEVPAAEKINNEIYQHTVIDIRNYAGKSKAELSTKISELEMEWDTERVLTTNLSAVTVVSTILGFTKSKYWFLLPGVVGLFFLQQALQGWSLPLSLIRRLGVRTEKEISSEKTALKILRGDFSSIPEEPEELLSRVLAA